MNILIVAILGHYFKFPPYSLIIEIHKRMERRHYQNEIPKIEFKLFKLYYILK